MTRPEQLGRVRALQGRRAGIVSRTAADIIDLVVALVIVLFLFALVWLIGLFFGGPTDFASIVSGTRGILLPLVLLLYLAYGWGLNGQTLGKLLLGLRVVRGDGGDVSFMRGLGRAALYVAFPIGLAWALVSSKNASVQDLLLGTAVVHDWDLASTPAIEVRRGTTG